MKKAKISAISAAAGRAASVAVGGVDGQSSRDHQGNGVFVAAPTVYREWIARPDGSGFWVECNRPIAQAATELERKARRLLAGRV